MSGLIFLPTQDLQGTVRFYSQRLDMRLWLDQGSCTILQHGNLLLGFCEGPDSSFEGIITLFFETREDVDSAYTRLQDLAESPPKLNETYHIYHFFAKDPGGRRLEFQCFLHDLLPFASGHDLLLTRRSIRRYEQRVVPQDVLWEVLALCRWAPTARNSQAITYTVVRDPEVIAALAAERAPNSAPIGAAPIAVAISADPDRTSLPDQDACIAAYHLTLSARLHGLGTCWIGHMNREQVKMRLEIPQEHYLATVTPLGYPAEWPEARRRHPIQGKVKFLDGSDRS